MQISIPMISESASPLMRTPVKPGSVAYYQAQIRNLKIDLKEKEKDLAVANQLGSIKKEIEGIRAKIEKAKAATRSSFDVDAAKKQIAVLKAKYDKVKDKLIDLSNVNPVKVKAKRDAIASKISAAEVNLKKKQDAEAKEKTERKAKEADIKEKISKVPTPKVVNKGVTDAATQKKVDALRVKRDAEIAKIQEDYKQQIVALLKGRSEIRKEGIRPLSSTRPRPMKTARR